MDINFKSVFYLKRKYKNISADDMNFLVEHAESSLIHRSRYCVHHNESPVQEMFVSLTKDSYIRPHKHLNKSESLHVIDGNADAVFFDDVGNIIQILRMGNYHSNKQFFYRIDQPIFHTLRLLTPTFSFHEVIQGPYDKADTLFAPWTPDPHDVDKVSLFLQSLNSKIHDFNFGSS